MDDSYLDGCILSRVDFSDEILWLIQSGHARFVFQHHEGDTEIILGDSLQHGTVAYLIEYWSGSGHQAVCLAESRGYSSIPMGFRLSIDSNIGWTVRLHQRTPWPASGCVHWYILTLLPPSHTRVEGRGLPWTLTNKTNSELNSNAGYLVHTWYFSTGEWYMFFAGDPGHNGTACNLVLTVE